jgi:hypothetical protein
MLSSNNIIPRSCHLTLEGNRGYQSTLTILSRSYPSTLKKLGIPLVITMQTVPIPPWQVGHGKQDEHGVQQHGLQGNPLIDAMTVINYLS